MHMEQQLLEKRVKWENDMSTNTETVQWAAGRKCIQSGVNSKNFFYFSFI